MPEDRRRAKRIPLDSLYFVKINFESDDVITCLVLDISVGGLMMGLPPGMENVTPPIGSKGVIKDSSPEIAEVLEPELEVTIMWAKEGLCGISFDEPQLQVIQSFDHDDFE